MKFPVTPAIRVLKSAGIQYSTHLYTYKERGGTGASAEALNVSESIVIKTLIFKDDQGHPMVILMPGDREVSTKALARLLGVKFVAPCVPGEAQKFSGYQVGGTSPFGLRKSMPVYMEKAVSELETLYINGGKRGFLVSMAPGVLLDLLHPVLVEVGIK
jgi:Cys-tRNA(Pro) deacylase